MSGSTQPVTQTWRATEPRYPPHGITYPTQIARPHAVRGARGPLGGLLLSLGPRPIPFLLGVRAGVSLRP